MKKYIILLLFLLPLCIILGSCEQAEIPETTASVWAYILENDNVRFSKLEVGNSYVLSSAKAIFSNKKVITYNQPFTIETDGNVLIRSDNEGLFFHMGDVKNYVIVSNPTPSQNQQTSYGGGTFAFYFERMMEEDAWQYASTPPSNTMRSFTISIWNKDNLTLMGDPQIMIKVQLTYKTPQSSMENGYTLEIISIEHLPSAYW